MIPEAMNIVSNPDFAKWLCPYPLLILTIGLLLVLALTLIIMNFTFRITVREVQKSRNRIDMILNGANLGYWDWNLITDQICFNESFLKMLGYSSSELQPHFDTWKALIHPNDRPRVTRQLDDHLTGRENNYECEYRVKTRDGDWKWVLSRGHIMERDRSGKPTHFSGTHLDISERIKIMDNLKSAIEKGKESDRLKASFLANISHEIRTPLNGIIGFCEMLMEEDVSNTERIDYSRIILKSGEQLLTLVNDILDLTRIDAGQVDVILSVLSIHEILQDLHDFFAPAFQQKGIGFSIEYHNEADDDELTTDWEKLQHILTNLIDNALKFTDSGEVTVECHRDEDSMIFTVKDTGPGIASDNHDRIFERFSVLEGVPVNKQGPGLGLAISRGYAESLGGSLHVKSDIGKGAIFQLVLPYP